jgi:hypothetical protein
MYCSLGDLGEVGITLLLVVRAMIYNRALTSSEVYELDVVPVPGALILDSIGLGFARRVLRGKQEG